MKTDRPTTKDNCENIKEKSLELPSLEVTSSKLCW